MSTVGLGVHYIACPLTSALNWSSWFKKVACLLSVEVTDPVTPYHVVEQYLSG